LPCEFNRSLALLYQAIEQHHPVLVLCVGQAGGRSEISIERIAINIDDARIKDNAGNQPIDTPVIADAPAAYFANLPIKRMLLALHQGEIPAVISNTAGTYVCNHVMYGLLHHINQHEPHIKGGFIHIPYLPSQALHHNGAPSMSEDTVLSALKVLINEAISTKLDTKVAAGTTH
jgi:pyroglutamyl-peptidase